MPFRTSRLNRLQKIIDTQAAIVQADLDLDRFMQIVVDTLQELTNSKGAIVEIVDDEFMEYRCGSGAFQEHVGLRLRRNQSLSGLCVSTGQVLRCDDAENDPRVDKKACRRVGVRSMVCTPLFQAGAPVGVLKVMSSRADAFDETDVQTLNLFGGMLGAALGKQLAFDALQRAETRIRVILENAHDAVITVNKAGIILRWNTAAEHLLGWSVSEAIGHNIKTFGHVEGGCGIFALFAAFNSHESKQQQARGEQMITARQGTPMFVEYSFNRNVFGDMEEVTAFIRDVTDRKNLENSLRELAQTDVLTGLANRRKIMESITQAIVRSRRQHNGMALFFMDMNGFKRINDEHGHDVGDTALKVFSQRLLLSVRETDVVGRLGGDEFIVLAEGIDSVQQAFVLAKKIVSSLDTPMPAPVIQLATSIGISLFQPSFDAEAWLNAADNAMYEAKQQQATQRNRIAAWSEGKLANPPHF